MGRTHFRPIMYYELDCIKVSKNLIERKNDKMIILNLTPLNLYTADISSGPTRNSSGVTNNIKIGSVTSMCNTTNTLKLKQLNRIQPSANILLLKPVLLLL